jgi:hypothetical protein
MNELGRSLKYDPVVADALFGDSRHKGGLTAERELMAAILADAIDCYWKYFNGRDGRSMRLFRDASHWIFSDDEAQTFSFLNICDALSLDAAYIRRGIVEGTKTRRQVEPDALTPRQRRLQKLKRNFKSATRWKIRSTPFKV